MIPETLVIGLLWAIALLSIPVIIHWIWEVFERKVLKRKAAARADSKASFLIREPVIKEKVIKKERNDVGTNH